MQTEEFRRYFILIFTNVFNELQLCVTLRYFVIAIVIKGIVQFSDHTWVQEHIHKRADESFIFVICNPATLVNNCCQRAYNRKLDTFLFVNHHFELIFRHK